jgi:uncharacterized protein (DUF1697 family)
MQYAAFLRAINVGGRIVKMTELATVFTAAGLEDVSTFLASGNVLFSTVEGDMAALECRIESGFRAVFGYDSQVFVRSAEQMVKVAAYEPFSADEVKLALTSCIGFTRAPFSEDTEAALTRIGADADRLIANGSEIYWLSMNSQAEPSFTLKQLEKAIGMHATFRGRNTIARITQRLTGSKE